MYNTALQCKKSKAQPTLLSTTSPFLFPRLEDVEVTEELLDCWKKDGNDFDTPESEADSSSFSPGKDTSNAVGRRRGAMIVSETVVALTGGLRSNVRVGTNVLQDSEFGVIKWKLDALYYPS